MPEPWRSVGRKSLVLLGILLAGAVFWWLGELIGFPRYRGFNASLLLQPAGLLKLLAAALGIFVMALLCTLLAGRVRYDAGWACAVAGLYALRLRGGPITSSIDDRTPAVFLTLAAELALLGAVLAAAWYALHALRERGDGERPMLGLLELPDARTRLADRKATAESLDQKLLALALGAGTMAVFMAILCRTPERAQVFFAVGVSAYLSAWITHAFIPTRPAAWFWAAPIVCGLLGYFWAWMATPQWLLDIGMPGGFLAPLARPMPLDYASIGVAAALWRYVQSRTHQTRLAIQAQREETAQAASTPAAA